MLLSGGGENEDAVAELLLSDLRDLFDARGVGRLTSAEIVKALGKMEERPWPEWKQEKPITTRQLARMVTPFDVRPTQFKVDREKTRGYQREDFEDAFERYLPLLPPTPPFPSGTTGTFQSGERFPAEIDPVPQRAGTGSKNPGKPRQYSKVPMVPDEKGGDGQETSFRPTIGTYESIEPEELDDENRQYLEDERAGVRTEEPVEDAPVTNGKGTPDPDARTPSPELWEGPQEPDDTADRAEGVL